MAKVELKKPIVKEIAESIQGASSVVIVDYLGITVEQDVRLRRKMREEGLVYRVYKNTMMNFAFQDTEFAELQSVLEGPSAIVISKDDATAAARIIAQFAKEAPALEIKAGIVEGTFYDAEAMKEIAAIPSRDELISKLLGSLQSPIANFARVIKQIAEAGGGDAAAEAAPEKEASAEEAPAEETPVEEATPEATEEAPAEETPSEETSEEA